MPEKLSPVPEKLPPELQAQLVAELKDIHLPDAVAWWPPAIGWWLLAGLLCLSLGFIFYRLSPKLYRSWRFRQQKRFWLACLKNIRQQHLKDLDASATLNACATLLKRILLTHYARNDIAHLTGDAWMTRLRSESTAFSSSSWALFTQARFQKNAISDEHITILLQEAQQWIQAYQAPNAQPIQHRTTPFRAENTETVHTKPFSFLRVKP